MHLGLRWYCSSSIRHDAPWPNLRWVQRWAVGNWYQLWSLWDTSQQTALFFEIWFEQWTYLYPWVQPKEKSYTSYSRNHRYVLFSLHLPDTEGIRPCIFLYVGHTWPFGILDQSRPLWSLGSTFSRGMPKKRNIMWSAFYGMHFF